jgi:hypothetical protein
LTVNYLDPFGSLYYSVVISKFDSNFNPEWEKTHYFSINSTFTQDPCSRLFSNEDSSIYILSSVSNDNFRILRYNLSGTLITSSDLSSKITYQGLIYYLYTDEIKSISELPNGSIGFCGFCVSLTQSSISASHLFYSQLNSNLVLENSRFSPIDNNSGKTFYAAAFSNSNLIFVGTNFFQNKLTFCAQNFDLSALEFKPANDYSELKSFIGVGCLSNLDGTFSVVGRSEFNDLSNHTFFIKLNSDGSLVK